MSSSRLIKFLFLVSVLLLGSLGAYLYLNHQPIKLISPVLAKTQMPLADNVWAPQEASDSAFPQISEMTAESAYFIDADTGQVLYAKNAHEKLQIASLTKIMSVIVTLQHKKLTDKIDISSQAAATEPDKMFLQAGEELSVNELLDGIFLVSANDAAEALAERVTGIRDEFIDLMNQKALELGMNNTRFINPTGLMEDGKDQYSTAYDVALMSRYLIQKWPQVLDISSQPHIYLDQTSQHQDYDLNSGINLLTTYPGVKGLKTGYTPEAGLTLVTYAERGNHRVIGVILDATDRRDDARKLLNYSFSYYGLPAVN